jgi:DNA polymerase III alpha subunit (gram-positive type)
VLWLRRAPLADYYGMDRTSEGGVCPACKQGELISIEMVVSERDLTFTTCHLCEAKWWYRDGHEVPLQSVIGTVVGAD